MDKEFIVLSNEYYEELEKLQCLYKVEIGENPPSKSQLEALRQAIENKKIIFYGCLHNNKLVGCCSICFTFSTLEYRMTGVFEDFYIEVAYRHKGIARELVKFAYHTSGVNSLTVGAADCDVEMYKSIGFKIKLGNMLAFEN